MVITEQKTNYSFGRKLKRVAVKGAVYLTLMYGAVAAIDYHLTNDRITKDLLSLRTNEVTSLVNNDKKYIQLEQKVVALKKEQDNVLFSHSLWWPKNAYDMINKK